MALSRELISLNGRKWQTLGGVGCRSYICGYCGDKVASGEGYRSDADPNGKYSAIIICPGCDGPTLFTGYGYQFPTAAPGMSVPGVPDEISQLYDEARHCAGESAYTASVMLCRKLLMHIAVQEGAKKDGSFAEYVTYLADKGFLPPNGKSWVDHIRKRGNEANHEIKFMDAEDATLLISFVEMILRFIYEFPSKVPADAEAVASN